MRIFTFSAFLTLAATAILALGNLSAKGQTVYLENFDNGLPTDYIVIDNDGLPVAAQVSGLFTDAWIENDDPTDPNGKVMSSTSWYDPAGSSDDWLITPPIAIGSNSRLIFRAWAQDPQFPDGMKVFISNTGPTIADFQPNLALYDELQMPSTPTIVNLDLANLGWANDTVRFAFVNQSNDKFILHVDDIEIFNPSPTDLASTGAWLDIQGATCEGDVEVSIDIFNNGLNAVTGFDVMYSVNGQAPHSENLAITINPGQTISYPFNQRAGLQSGLNSIETWVAASGDGLISNDTTENVLEILMAPSGNSPLDDDFESGNPTIVGLHAGADANVSVADFAGNNSVYGVVLEGGDPSNWVNQFTDNDIWANNQSYSSYAAMCVDPGTSTSLALTFDASFLPTPFANSYWYNNMRLMINGSQVGNTYHIDTNATTPEYNTYTVDLTPYVGGPIEIIFEARNKYDFASADVVSQGTADYGDQIYLDNIVVEVPTAPVAAFAFNANNLDVTFTDQSTNSPTSWSWDFGDSGTSTDKNPLHTYADSGTYNVCLTVTNIIGSDQNCQSVTVTSPVQPNGIAQINANALVAVYPNPTNGTFTLNVSGARGEVNYEVFNTIGERLMVGSLQNNNSYQQTINMSSFADGIYVVKVMGNGLNTTQRITLAK